MTQKTSEVIAKRIGWEVEGCTKGEARKNKTGAGGRETKRTRRGLERRAVDAWGHRVKLDCCSDQTARNNETECEGNM